MKAMAEELKRLEVSGAAVSFTPEKPLARKLVEKIVRKRIEEPSFT
jgi:uncharacterized protein YdhG (YjbR/CyaY superfamily)